ncbi:MAG: helicase [Cytophagaceae bacterium]|nr:MAG: helicase [Cytophagaceae bacterium]
MVINFNGLSRPKGSSAPIDPFEIFSKTPNLEDSPNDLWKGQAEALTSWHARRSEEDNVILLNTGAGKSIVGILIAQSLVNEGTGPVVFACSTIDLVEQTARECDRLGLRYSKRTQGSFSNDLFETGAAFCITTYQSLFVSNTTFNGSKEPAAVIFDDAHVGERLIRDAFTLSVENAKFPELFRDIVAIVKPEFDAIGKESHFSFIMEEGGNFGTTMCPPITARKHGKEILEAIKRVPKWRDTDLLFPALRIWENIDKCAIYLSATSIEITPPFIPTGVYRFLGKGVRRIYLSATIEFETDFVRGFGRRARNPITPDNDAGNGERLILLSSALTAKVDKKDVAKELLKSHKLLISVPSYPKAAAWEAFGTPPTRAQFTDQLQAFRSSKNGSFILVSRIDGIDLPKDTCRVMLIDGAPTGSSLMDQYLYKHLTMLNLFSTKMAGRLTQLLGRINRGRSDYSAFVLFGDDINVWLKTERNVALLPPLIRKQVILSQTVQNDMTEAGPADIAGLVSQVLARDEGWLKFYRETVDGLEVSQDALERVKKRETQLAISAEAECKFMTLIWQGDTEGARTSLLDVLDSTALADAKLAGWYSVWLASTYEAAGDTQTAIAHYKKARARLSPWLNVPYKNEFDQQADAEGGKTNLQKKLLSVNNHGPQSLGNLVDRLKAQARTLTDPVQPFNVKEEALRLFGELIGFSASRPDSELGSGPDVIWKDEETQTLLAFELKTEKNDPADYSKKEVGQAHNHLQWLKDNDAEYASNGLLIVGPGGICRSDASPSAELFLVETKILAEVLRSFVAKIDDTRGGTAMERWTSLNELGGLAEWQLPGLFSRLALTPLASLKTA